MSDETPRHDEEAPEKASQQAPEKPSEKASDGASEETPHKSREEVSYGAPEEAPEAKEAPEQAQEGASDEDGEGDSEEASRETGGEVLGREEDGARSGLAVKWIALLAIAVVVGIVLWNFVFPWVLTLLPENF